jgi:hypothetical protein
MQDLETESLWSQVTGECIYGPKIGSRLIPFSTVHTSYAEFKKIYPNGVLLKKPAKGDKGSYYDSYFKDKDKLGIFGRLDSFEKLDGKDLIFGLNYNDFQIAISKEYISANKYIIVDKIHPPVIINYELSSNTITAYLLPENMSAKNTRIKSNKIQLINEDGDWNLFTGESLLDDIENLKRIPIITAYWFAWISFFPDTDLIK